MFRRGSSRLIWVLPGFTFSWFLEPFLGDFLGEVSRPFSWGFVGECMHEPFVVLFLLIPLPNPWEKGLDFGVFGVLGLEEFLAGFLRFLVIQRVLVDHNLSMECPWGVPTIPKVLFGSVEQSGDRELDLGELTRGFCSSRAAQVTPFWPLLLTGLTGLSPVWDLPRVSCWIRASLVCVGAVQFLTAWEVFWLALCRVLSPCRLCFEGVFVTGPREVTEAL
jgi:hypothetical protein